MDAWGNPTRTALVTPYPRFLSVPHIKKFHGVCMHVAKVKRSGGESLAKGNMEWARHGGLVVLETDCIESSHGARL